MFEQESAFYKTHQSEFQEKYFDKWLVIIGESLWGVYDTARDAANAALGQYEPGTFMVHTPANDGAVLETGPGIIRFRRNGDKAKAVTTGSRRKIAEITRV
jgi:hypothetical protein